MMTPASRKRAGCPVCGTAHAACGPPVAAEAAERAVDEPTMLVRRSAMAEEETQDKPAKLKLYKVRLDGNRGTTTMKLNEADAEAMGDRVEEDLGDAKTYGMPEGETKHADQTASREESDATKSRTASNKRKSPTDK